jgi:hypothetical protein
MVAGAHPVEATARTSSRVMGAVNPITLTPTLGLCAAVSDE